MYSLKNLEDIANEQVNGKTDTLIGIQRKLISWFCFTLDTTPTDSRLLEMTLEELIIFYFMHKIKEDPSYTSTDEKDDYEEWLKQEMGEGYLPEDKMIEECKLEEKKRQEEVEQIEKAYPKKITTNFNNPDKEE